MRYFIPASERQGSCYFEFQPGRWRGRCWLPGSILLADERWEALRLTELFGAGRAGDSRALRWEPCRNQSEAVERGRHAGCG